MRSSCAGSDYAIRNHVESGKAPNWLIEKSPNDFSALVTPVCRLPEMEGCNSASAEEDNQLTLK
jgi:hypothetical protein